jgi:hypothetical protein
MSSALRRLHLVRGGTVAAMAALVLGALMAMPGTAFASTRTATDAPSATDAPPVSPAAWVRCDECVYHSSYYNPLKYVAGDQCDNAGKSGLAKARWRKYECRYTHDYYGADLRVLWNA